MSRWIVALLSLAMLGCSDDDNPTMPALPNAAMYGTWAGTLSVTVASPIDTTLNLAPMMLTLARGDSALLVLNSDSFMVYVDTLADPRVAFSAVVYQFDSRFSGTRNGTTVQGVYTTTYPGVSGEWTVTK